MNPRPLDRLLSRLSGAQRTTGGWMALCPAHEDSEPSLSVSESDDGKIIVHCFAQCDPRDVVTAIGLTIGDLFPDAPSAKNGFPASRGTRRGPDRRELVDRILREAIPDPGRIADYLRHRGLSGAVPETLRFHPNLPYYDVKLRRRLPAIVAPVQRLDGTVVGVHRVYLDPNGPGKASVSTPKKLLAVHNGATRGAAIHLAEPGEMLAVAEGIETGLAVLEAAGRPTWATISASGMRALEVPTTVAQLNVWADRDTSYAGQRAADALARRTHNVARTVFVLLPGGEDARS